MVVWFDSALTTPTFSVSTFRTILKYRTRQSGFSLIEFITVIVILSIVSMLGAGFVITSVQSYDRVAQRSKLIGSGRQALERITRQLRASLPYSLRLSGDASGLCVEFMPVVGGGNYIGPDYDSNGSIDQEELPTMANGAVPGLAYDVITAPLRMQIEQLQRLPVVISSHSNANRTTPQWQLPR